MPETDRCNKKKHFLLHCLKSSNLRILDSLQNKAISSLQLNLHDPLGIQSLRHRRQVAGITVKYSVLCCLIHWVVLNYLSLKHIPWILPGSHLSASHQHTVVIQKYRTSQHQRSFLASYARLWNSLPASVVDVPSGQSFKSNVHHHLINLSPTQNIIMNFGLGIPHVSYSLGQCFN